MITREQWDAMSDIQRWDLFNAMQYEIAEADNAVDAGDDDEDMTYEREKPDPARRPKPGANASANEYPPPPRPDPAVNPIVVKGEVGGIFRRKR